MPTLIYILHSGQLYGTERMALATLAELACRVEAVLLAPPGPVHDEAQRLGIRSLSFGSLPALAARLWPLLQAPDVRLCSTGVSQALLGWFLGGLLWRLPQQVHVVHGGTDEHLSYGRKHWLQWLGIELVAVSAFVRERLLANRCSPEQITVIENFLSGSLPVRPALRREGALQVAMVTRLDPIKQVGLAVDAWNTLPASGRACLRVCGSGWQQAVLRQRSQGNPDIEWLGFVPATSQILLQSDLYLHTCPCEPFGLAILEAMAVGVPVLVPDSGGAGLLVEHGRTGFHYRAGDRADLCAQIQAIAKLPAEALDEVVTQARRQLQGRFSASARCDDYAALLGLGRAYEC